MPPKYRKVLYLLDRSHKDDFGSVFWKVTDYRESMAWLGGRSKVKVYVIKPELSAATLKDQCYGTWYECTEDEFDMYAQNEAVIFIYSEQELLSLRLKYADEIAV